MGDILEGSAQGDEEELDGCEEDFTAERQLNDKDVELFQLFPTGEKDEELERKWKEVFND